MKKDIVIIDSGCANIASVIYAIERLGHKATVTSDSSIIASAGKVILPGVGTARAAIQQIKERNLLQTIQNLKQPVIGFCLGMQLLFRHSQELNTTMLGIIDAPIVKFSMENMPVPHMGWNTVSLSESPLTKGIDNNSHFYFVHSYYADIGPYTIGQCTYGLDFSAIVQKDNFYGCQFHPEKSGKAGEQLLYNFIEGDV